MSKRDIGVAITGKTVPVTTFSRCSIKGLPVIKHENGDFLLQETRLVKPKSLQQKVIATAHEVRARIVCDKVYFSGIDKLFEEKCKSCIPSFVATPSKESEPLKNEQNTCLGQTVNILYF